jgi:hypothetical protein
LERRGCRRQRLTPPMLPLPPDPTSADRNVVYALWLESATALG